MPRHRLSLELWRDVRRRVLERDGFSCTRCGASLTLSTVHCDHRRSGKLADNSMTGLRSLCRRCHVLRADNRHRGMIANALKDGIIGPNWRSEVWDD